MNDDNQPTLKDLAQARDLVNRTLALYDSCHLATERARATERKAAELLISARSNLARMIQLSAHPNLARMRQLSEQSMRNMDIQPRTGRLSERDPADQVIPDQPLAGNTDQPEVIEGIHWTDGHHWTDDHPHPQVHPYLP